MNIFNKLDAALVELAKSDSSVEYAPHIRENFDQVIKELNELKSRLEFQQFESDKYFI